MAAAAVSRMAETNCQLFKWVMKWQMDICTVYIRIYLRYDACKLCYSLFYTKEGVDHITAFEEKHVHISKWISLFVWKGAPLGASVTPVRAKDGVLFMRSQFPTPRARQAFTPFCTNTEGHTCSALGSSTQGEWQWSTTQPRPEPGVFFR